MEIVMCIILINNVKIRYKIFQLQKDFLKLIFQISPSRGSHHVTTDDHQNYSPSDYFEQQRKKSYVDRGVSKQASPDYLNNGEGALSSPQHNYYQRSPFIQF